MTFHVKGIWKEDSYSVPHNALESKNLIPWVGMSFKIHHIFLNTDIYFLWAVDVQAKKNM